MKLLSSLRSRIFLASALLAVLCIGVAIYLVNVRVTEEAERTLEREIVATAAQVDQLRADAHRDLHADGATHRRRCRKLKAAVDTERSADGAGHRATATRTS